MLIRFHWLAASGSQGKPLRNQVRVHSITTQSPASASTATRRTGVDRPNIRGIVHQAARYQTPTHTPVKGPSRNSPSHETWCSQPRMMVHATICAPSSVRA